jgi:flagellum-specific ATP synthase
LSRLMPVLASAEHRGHAARIRDALAAHTEGKDLIDIGAYKPGANQRLDDAVMRMPAIDAFARQDIEDLTSLSDTLEMLQMVATAGGVG